MNHQVQKMTVSTSRQTIRFSSSSSTEIAKRRTTDRHPPAYFQTIV